MSDQIKMGLIIATAILIATGGYVYFSPYQSCVRNVRTHFADQNETTEESLITQICLQQMGSK